MQQSIRKTYKAIFCVFLATIMFVVSMPMAFAADEGDVIGKYNYTISNPYKDVNWDTWKPYRGATHVHTVRSDGNVELDDMIEDYYRLGYQCLALTDHGTVNYSWTENQTRLAIFGYQYFVHGNVDEISKERYQQITTGSDRNGDPMIEVPLGIELNGSSTSKCHVNSYFADCGHGDLEMSATWPEEAVQKCEKAGGVCHINHVGEWTEGKSDINTYDKAFVEKFSKLFLNYQSCVGMELVNTRDNRTHNDRYLYDETLKITAEQGVPIWGFCEDDAHDPEDCANNAQFFVMPENTWQNVRTSMETGAFFACSKTSKNPWELGDGFDAQGDFPMINRVVVDEEKDQIIFYPTRATVMKIVADGVVLDEKKVDGENMPVVFDLNKYENSINSYVRFYTTGAGGICYVQPFLISKDDLKVSTAKFNVTPANATLTMRDENGNIIAPANNQNEYVLPVGAYTCTIESNGFDTYTQHIAIRNNSTKLTYDINLSKTFIYSRNQAILGVDYDHQLLYGVSPGAKQSYVEMMIRPASGISVTYKNSDRGFGTGSVLSASDNAGNVKEYELVIFGDMNGDSIIDGEDAVLINVVGAGLYDYGEAYSLAADCDHNGDITDADALLTADSGIKKKVDIKQYP
ncbi:MAG: hypothetical protein MJ168_02800 [Clostridia bacterium]|nr:hypothetical protein [Clostridia bacterium]